MLDYIWAILYKFKCQNTIYFTKIFYLISSLEKIQRWVTKCILKLPFSCCQSCEQQLKTLSLLPISYWHEYLDMLLFFKITHGLVDIDPTVVPITHSTRHTIVCQYSCYKIVCTFKKMQDFNRSTAIYCMNNRNLEHSVR